MNPTPRKRRRVVRPSDAADYDRTADAPVFQSAFDADGERVVSLDPESTDDAPQTGRAFYEEQRPPHY